MNKWVIWFSVLTLASINCEPPVNSYLPPGNGGRNMPSTQYGSPRSNNGGQPGSGVPGTSSFSSRDSYSTNGQRSRSNVDTKYGTPSEQSFTSNSGNGFGSSSSTEFNGQQSNGHGNSSPSKTPGGGMNSRLQSTYGPPNRGQAEGNRGFGSSGNGFGQQPDTNYGPPANGVSRSGNGFGSNNQSPTQRAGSHRASESSYNTPSEGSLRFDGSQSPGSPSSSYGAPRFGAGGNGQSASNQGSHFEGNESNEPAKYEFSYDVDDALTGTKFGHSEQRDGDLATGEYNVVLPDGRKQVVEYEAGLEGYKPQIRYEGGNGGGAGNGFGSGVGSGPYSGSGGYFRGGPENGNFNNGITSQSAGQDGDIVSDQQQESFGHNSQGYPTQQGSQGGPTGYPSRGPGGNGRNGNRGGSNGYSNGKFTGGDSDSQGFSGGPSNGNQIGGGGNSGYPSGAPQGSQGHGGQNPNFGGDEGYPRGGPNGPRGSGY